MAEELSLPALSSDLASNDKSKDSTVLTNPTIPLDGAALLSRHGVAVAPVKPGKKHPDIDDWEHNASADPDVIQGWYNQKRYWNHGVSAICGPRSGNLVVIDVDVKDPTKPGPDSLKKFLDERGVKKLPITWTVKTPTGGLHFYYHYPEGHTIRNDRDSKLGPGVDIRAEGGQVIAPPSLGLDGITPYTWVKGRSPSETVLAELPDYLLEVLDEGAVTEAPRPPPARSIPSPLSLNGTFDEIVNAYNASHTWDDLLTADGWTLEKIDANGEQHWRRPGKGEPEESSATVGYAGQEWLLYVFTTSLSWLPANDLSKAGYDRWGYMVRSPSYEFNGDFSAAGRAYGNRSGKTDLNAILPTTLIPVETDATTIAPSKEIKVETDKPQRRLERTPASAIEVKPVHWLWDNRIPLGELTLLAGREGLGKSTIAYTLVAWITAGTMGGRFYGTPKTVIIAASEDSWEHTIVPRLMGAGANLDLVYRVDVVTEDGLQGSLSLPSDIMALRQHVDEIEAAMVLLDPLMSRLDGKLDSHKDHEVRQALEPLVSFAKAAHVAVMGIIHVNKSASADVLNAIMGSRAFVAVARSVLFAVKGPDHDGTSLFGQAKSNLGPKDERTYRYEIGGIKVAETPDGDVWTGRIKWCGKSDKSVEDIVAAMAEGGADELTAVDEAAAWLEDWLEANGGAKESSIVKAEARKVGHTERTIQRAARQLDLTKRSEGFPRKTIWALPFGTTGATVPTGDSSSDQSCQPF